MLDFPYRIQIYKDSLKYSARIGEDIVFYREKLTYDWTILDSVKIINKYNCKLATTNYAGRKWYAWFTEDIPIDVGPYKFKGLPGCVVNMYSDNNYFLYELMAYKKRTKLRFTPYPYILRKNQIEKSQLAFNKLRKAYSNMSFNERMAYMNRNDPDKSGARLVAVGGDDSLIKNSMNLISEYEWIEIDSGG